MSDFLEFKKSQNQKYSYRYLGLKLGISPSTFNKVIQKKRNLSLDLSLKFSELFKFSKNEKEYLQLLILFEKAKDPDERKRCLMKLAKFRINNKQGNSEAAQATFQQLPWQQMDFSTITLNISSKNLQVFKEKITALGKELAAKEGPPGEADCVYQFNFHMFPLTQPPS